jgi:hypothetical protein
VVGGVGQGTPSTSANLARRKFRGEKSLAWRKRHAKKIQFAAPRFIGQILWGCWRALCIEAALLRCE